MSKTLFLFDLDGVLVYPGGYKEALTATVDHFAAQMGQAPVGLTLDEIAEFEACGITNEWDSASMCAAMMVIDALLHRPEPARDGIEGALQAIRDSGESIARPDFTTAAREVSARTPRGAPPTETITQIMRERAGGKLGSLLDDLLGDIYSMKTPTTRALQHFTLGSERFRQTYGLEPEIDTESLLITRDRPLISRETRQRLLARVEPGRSGMAIYTARPSLPPPGTQPTDTTGAYSPEANLAMELLDLPVHVPLIASGSMSWLAAARGKVPADYIKPSPVQALAAIGAARSGKIIDALEAAAQLVEENRIDGPLSLLAGKPTLVVVFEDAQGGIQATRKAVDLLSKAGLPVTCEAVGVAKEATKRQALETVADRVVDDVNEGLASYFVSYYTQRDCNSNCCV
ncbi:MAG: hypothetical protein JXB07_13925 [Anaerolineae bacterium]|nr:hypothetical protein [Anaerolineae bacterium]